MQSIESRRKMITWVSVAVKEVVSGKRLTTVVTHDFSPSLIATIMNMARERVPCGPIGEIVVMSADEAAEKWRQGRGVLGRPPCMIIIDEAHDGFDSAVVAELAKKAEKRKPGPVPVGNKVQCNMSLEAEGVARADSLAMLYDVSRSRVMRDGMAYALDHVDGWAHGLERDEGDSE